VSKLKSSPLVSLMMPCLDAERRRKEEIGALPVVEGVDVDTDHVVRSEVLALLQAGPDVGARLDADEPDVEVVGVVGQVSRGRLRGRFEILGPALPEIRDLHPRCRAARQEVLQPRRDVDARNRDGGRRQRLRAGGRGPGEQQHQQHERERDAGDHARLAAGDQARNGLVRRSWPIVVEGP
jgi:hypothetical protein